MKRFFQTAAMLLLVLLCLVPVTDIDAAAAVGGTCGNGITWTLDKGVLLLKGSGEMADYNGDKSKAPWASLADDITTVIAQPNITHIGNYAFTECDNLRTVQLPDVVTVGSYAFYDCDSLQSVSLPKGKSIGERAFGNCWYMTSADLPVLETMGIGGFRGCGLLVTVNAPALKAIPNDAFYNCMDLTAAVFPAAQSVGSNAFGNCVLLESADLPLAATVGEGAFSNCYVLTDPNLPEVTVLRKNVFKNCHALGEVSFPAVTAMERHAFLNCTGMRSVSLPALTTVPDYAFELATGLVSVDLPKVTYLGKYAFNGCESLQSIYLPELTEMQPYAFRCCFALEEADLPRLTAVANYGFYQCTSLQRLSLPSLTQVGDFSFQECYSLQYIDMPLVTEIGNCGFYLCANLLEAHLPAVKTIDGNAFNNCRSLELLSVSTDLNTVGSRAFEACKALEAVYISGDPADWEDIVVNGYNNDYFLTAEKIFGKAPFTAEALPETVSVVKGHNAELTINVRGSGCSYQWQKRTEDTEDWQDIQGASTAKLSFGPVSDTHEGLKLRCVVTDRHGDRLTSTVTVLHLTPFADVAASDYFFTPVQWAVEHGITSGVSDLLFGSESPCTRAQVVTFLWAAADRPTPESTDLPFTDVPADAYYRTAVQWAVEQSITSGISAEEFGPDVTCTRAQIVTMLWRAADSPIMHKFDIPDIFAPDFPVEYDPESGEGTADTEQDIEIVNKTPFTDVAPLDYYYQAVLWALEGGITAGTSATTFGSDAPCTRAQIVTFLYKDSLN